VENKSKLGKKLAALVAGSALTLGGCNEDPQNLSSYSFCGSLNGEKVTFAIVQPLPFHYNANTLTVEKEDGRVIIHYDLGNDRSLDRVFVKEKSQSVYEEYGPTTLAGVEVLRVAQQQYDSYLQKIREYQIGLALQAPEKIR